MISIRDDRARLIAAVTAVTVLVGLVIQVISTSRTTNGYFDTRAERVANVFCFFTVLSNILLGATNGALASNPNRRGPVFSALRLAGVLSMAVTGVVYWLALHGLQDLHGSAAVANIILHTVTPILGVIGWVVAGPRGTVTGRVIAMTVLYPVAWLIATLIRGAIVDYYPYPFLDATTHDYLRVTVNCIIVAALFLGLAFGAARLDQKLTPSATNLDQQGPN